MSKRFEGEVKPRAPEGAPNVLYIVWDDTGYASWDVYGGLIEMPTMRRLADRGVMFSQFHTVASRSCLLTGRNATGNGMAGIEENGTIAEVLVERGWNTYAVGTWHLTPAEEGSMPSSHPTWPLDRGFERYYGVLGEVHHPSTDLADKAIEFIEDAKAPAADTPFFMYFRPGANHAPHQVPEQWAERYAGVFDMGYEKYRELVLANQKRLGLVPEHTRLPPISADADATAADGTRWPETDTVRPWDSLSDDEKRLSNRMAEVFAGYSSFTDHQIGRLLDHLEESGRLQNTIIVWVSDNGAGAQGGPSGTLDENGWAMAFSTPFKPFMRDSGQEGGTADPLVISWPKGIAARAETRHQYLHAIDVVPTVYDLLGITPPEQIGGHAQSPIHGASFRGVFDDREAPQPRDTQLYAMLGTRGIWHDGWFAGTVHPSLTSGWSHVDDDVWELYHLAEDRNQMHDLAAVHPARLEAMKKLWFAEAARYDGLPAFARD